MDFRELYRELEHKERHHDRYFEKLKEVGERIDFLEGESDCISTALDELVDLNIQVQNYANTRKGTTLETLTKAIEASLSIVPNAQNYELIIENQKAVIGRKDPLTGTLLPIKDQEGCGANSVLTVVLQLTLLALQPHAIPVIFIDEGLAGLSKPNRESFNEVMQLLSPDFYVVIVEQKFVSELYEGWLDQYYQYRKVDGVTTIALQRLSDPEYYVEVTR